MLPSGYGAGAGHVLVEPPSGLQGGSATAELAVADGWFVGAITNKSESSLLDSTNCHFWWSGQSLVWLSHVDIYFPSQEALLWAVLARAHAAYSSTLAAQVRVTPACLPSQMARFFSDMSAVGCDPDLLLKSRQSYAARYCGVLVAH